MTSKGAKLENLISQILKRNNFMVFTRCNNCDVVAFRGKLAYLIECKNYDLSYKQQVKAVKQLNKNVSNALWILGSTVDSLAVVLIAQSFNHRSQHIFQYTPEQFLAHINR